MKRTIFFGGLVLWALAAGAEARDWGFDKDTVYEWKAGGDTVLLANNGTNTLQLDSVMAEGSGWGDMVFLYHPPGPVLEDWWCLLSEWDPRACSIKGAGIPAGQVWVFHEFRVGEMCPTAKVSAVAGDTASIRVRLISGLEEDTLVVRGTSCPPTSIMLSPDHFQLFKDHFPVRDIRWRDILGRSVRSPAKPPNLIRKAIP